MVSDGKVKGDISIANMPWVEKYRPASLTELVSHEEITETRKLFYFFFTVFC